METITVAVVGVGRWGINHVRVLSELKNNPPPDFQAQVGEIIIVDTNLKRARLVAEGFKLSSYYGSVDEAFSAHDIDAAIVAVPTVFHFKVASEIIGRSHLLIEKPLTSSLREGITLVRMAEKLGRIVMVGHIERFNPVVIAAKERVDRTGESIVHILGLRIGPGPPSGRGGNLGVAHDLLVHDIDIANLLVSGLPKRVLATALRDPSYPYEVEVSAIYEYEGGVEAYLRASWRTGPRLKKRTMSIQTRNHVISFDYIAQTLTIERGLAEHRSSGEYMDLISKYASRAVENLSLITGRAKEPLLAEVSNFLESAAGRSKPLVDARSGYAALKCAIAALESSNRGMPVQISWNEL